KKGFATLIEACRLLRDAGKLARCRIVGYGEEHDRLAGLISRHGLNDAVELAGKMTQDELIDLYRSASVFALPCQVASDGDRDGIPNVLLEAMAMELAVVSTSVSGIPEVIQNGINGLLVPPGDAAALATAIGCLVDDPALRSRLRQLIIGHLLQTRSSIALAGLCLLGALLMELLAPWPLKLIFDHVLMGKPLAPSWSYLGWLFQWGPLPAVAILSASVFLMVL